MKSFDEYLNLTYDPRNGTAKSYLRAIRILDDIFSQYDVLKLNGKSLTSITDIGELSSIIEFIKGEERKMKNGIDSIFNYINPNQTSYPKKGWCSAAVKSLFNFRLSIIDDKATEFVKSAKSKSELMKSLKRLTSITDTESYAEIHKRIGQDVFRTILLEIYNGQCCVCGLNIKELLRASHILPWSDHKKERLDPENGLCLSATYDVAFDRHLISFDNEYRMVVSRYIRDFYTNETAKEYFERYEGQKLIMPNKYYPNKEYLSQHIEKLIC